jgi:putative transposase
VHTKASLWVRFFVGLVLRVAFPLVGHFVSSVYSISHINPLFMANTFSQIYLQFVFAVQNRSNLISSRNKEELHKYITGLVSKRKAKMLAVNCMPDHTHLFVGFRPVISISDFMKEIKVESNEFINGKKWIHGKFGWQDGYGVFSYSQSHLTRVIRYIQNQEKHHETKTFRQEYHEFLKKFQIEFDENYLFDFFD